MRWLDGITDTYWCLYINIVVQFLSHVWLFATPWTAAGQTSLSFTISWSLLKLMFIESGMPSNHLVLCCPLLLLPSIFPSIRVFSNDLALHIRCPKQWSVSFSIHPFNEYSGLISFRIDWLDLLAVQGTLKSLLQHHSSKPSILPVLSFLYSPTLTSIHDYWKNHSFDWMDLCRWTFFDGSSWCYFCIRGMNTNLEIWFIHLIVNLMCLICPAS